MKTVIMAVYDKATEAFMRPWNAQSKGQASRMFADEVRREGTDLNTHPEDYTLFHIGNYDDQAGMLEPMEPTRVISGIDVLQKGDDK